tara:strand:+ start:1248 stop:2585 length:1338 start_codon:yes stop_codon:yes gene_type:complete
MKYTILLILTFLTCLLSYNLDDYNLEKSKKSTGLSNTYYSSGYDNQILDEFIDENIYIIGPGDVFLFNMITINRTMTLELSVSPSGDVLIPVVGKVNLKDKTLKEAYKIMKNKCIQKYEDAFVYINLIKLRKFKILVIGESDRAGMHTVSSENRVSDLIESLHEFNYMDSLLMRHILNFPKNIMIDKDIKLIRNDSVININLFDYYLSGKKTENPILIEGDVISISTTDKITVLGEINSPIRIKKEAFMTYNDVLKEAGGVTELGDLNKIKFLNYRSISSYYNNERNRISSIDPKYRSDTDESFLSARNKTLDGMIYISDNIKLEDFLNSKVSEGDILIIPQKNNFVEVLGGVNNPGAYIYNKNKTVYDYILNAGDYTKVAKDIYVLDVNSGSRIKVEKSFVPQPGSIIFIEERIGYKKWDRIKDVIALIASIASSLLILSNVLG